MNRYTVNGSKSTGEVWVEDANGKRLCPMAGDEAETARQILSYLINLERRIEQKSDGLSFTGSLNAVSSQPLSFE
ncbi:MAG: hypothetical protein H0U63_02390 [Burkholderiales bacterium]|nr:hypothetical protein [Burkholderiales bacterium]